MDWLDYREKLGIGFEDKEKAEYFFVKIFNFLNYLESTSNQITFAEYFNFCNTVGIPVQNHYKDSVPFDSIVEILDSKRYDLSIFLAYYITFINCQVDNEDKTWSKEDFEIVLYKCLDESHIPYEIIKDNDGLFVFPKGAKELDDALVSQPLEWLKDYPNTYKTYSIALKQYSEGIYIRDVADNFRKSLEDFLREFLNNDKDLNANKKEVETYLKSVDADPHLIKMLVSLISHYYLLNNEVAKHNDKIDEKYLEFLMYQTGVFIRMLIVVKQAEGV